MKKSWRTLENSEIYEGSNEEDNYDEDEEIEDNDDEKESIF